MKNYFLVGFRKFFYEMSDYIIDCFQAPGFGDNRKNTIKDMAIATGATVFGDEAMDVKLEQLQMHDFGEVGEVVVTKDDTLMLNGKGSLADIEARVIRVNDAIEKSNSEYEKVGIVYILLRLL